MSRIDQLEKEIAGLYRIAGKLMQRLDEHQPLNIKELAAAIHRHRNYITAMKRAGFQMLNGRASVHDAKVWLSRHPDFRTTKTSAKKCMKADT